MSGGADNVVPLHDERPELDLDAARRHFELFEQLAEGLGGWFVLSSFGEDPDTGSKIETIIRPVENKRTQQGSPAARLMNAAHALADDEHRNIYLSSVLLKSQPIDGGRGKAADVFRVLALPQDFDDENAADYLTRCPLAPDYVVETSPGRFQAWYFPTKPLPASRARPLLQALTKATGADSSSATINQPMRVPGLRNWPSISKVQGGRSRTPTLARIVQDCEDDRTSIDDLEHALEAAAPSVATGGADSGEPLAEWTTGPVPGAAPIGEDDALIERALASTSARAAFGGGASFSDLWNANSDALAKAFPAAGGFDESRADSALAMHLAWWTGKDCERIDRLMRRSALAREKWQREGTGASNYLRHTILRAVEKTQDVYTGQAGDTDDVPEWVATLNAEYMLVNYHGRAVVLRPSYDPSLGRRHFQKIERGDFCALFDNRRVPVSAGENTKFTPMGSAWLKHPAVRSYVKGVTFAPRRKLPSGWLNLWQGFGVDPTPGDWSRFRDHIRDVIAAGDPRLERYIIGWLARMVQEPEKPGEVALVLRGGKGTGKGKFANWIAHLWGQHAFATGNANHIIGRFNMHLQDVVFLFGDEAFYAGDRQHESSLKTLVTEPTIPIEGKGVNAVTARNCIHLLMASNKNWVVPASHDERRYAVMDVSEHRRQDFAYFAAIDEQMKAGGAEAMLHDLLKYDIEEFEVREVPGTAALDEQKQLSLEGPAAWLFDVLDAGRIGAHVWTDEGLTIPKDSAYHQFCEFSKRAREYRPAHAAAWGRAIKNALPRAVKTTRPRVGESRENRLEFASLETCRDTFQESMNMGPIRWDDAYDDMTIDDSDGDAHIDVFS